MISRLIAVFILLSAFIGKVAFANDEPSPAIPDGVITFKVTDPDRNAGYMMGDLLTRHLILEVKKPYKMVDSSLPIVGYERRYQGQVTGIELRKINHEFRDHPQSVTYALDLTYQVFATAPVVKPAVLPKEVIKFQGPASEEAKDGLYQYTIPSFYFRISPMVVYGAVKVEQDLSPYHPPFLLQTYPEKQKLVAYGSVLLIAFLSLVYILGQLAWIPIMGRPFAIAGRQLRKRARSKDIKGMINDLHAALNKTAGYSVFSDNLDRLFAEKPKFKLIENELYAFFKQSNQVFFETKNVNIDETAVIGFLKRFCRQCRDCERGLKPTPQTLKG
jgi:mxaA protein